MLSMRCGMFCLAGVIVGTGLLVRPARAEDARAEADLTFKIQDVLYRHCMRCHGEAAKGGIRLLDRNLLVKQRQVVRPGAADASELLDLVEGGSMPPGNIPKVPREEQALLRQWIESGAPAILDRREESYVLWNIVRDRERLGEKWKPSFRYLSLNHLLAPDGTTGDLDPQREALERVLRYLTAEDAPEPVLERIDPVGAVLRIDLQRLGWDRRPYEDKSELNLFDLALLEYPNGRLPTDSPLYAEVFRFLKSAAQVRPIPYVRADWLARAVTTGPLHADFRAVLGKAPDSKPPEEIKPRLRPSDAAALVYRQDTNGEAKIAPRGAPIPPRPPRPAADEERRRLLQEHLAELTVADKRGGVPIFPLDGLTYPRHNADPSFAVTFKAIDFEQRHLEDPPAKDTFVVGDRMALWIKTTEKTFVELIQTDKRGVKTIKFKGSILADRVMLLPPQGAQMLLEDNEEQDNEEYTLYAYGDAALEAEKAPFPAGKVLHTDKIHDRILHPLYQLRPDGQGLQPPDANKLVKMTVRIATIRRGQKKD